MIDHGREVACIEHHGQGCELEPLALAIQSCQVWLAVVHMARRHVRIGDQRMLAVRGVMILVEETLRLAFSAHLARILVSCADLDLFGLHHLVARLEWGLAMPGTICVNGRIKLGQVGHWLLLNLVYREAFFVGAGLEVRAVAVEHLPTNGAMLDRLLDDGLKDVLLNACACKTPTPVLRKRRCIRHAIVGFSSANQR